MADRLRLLVLCGPTASGKTALSIELAQRLDGEIISADSMQIYTGLPVGTAQPTKEERARVPHHLVDFLLPEESFSVAQYVQLASQCIREVATRGKTPILAGGTGLYISSLTQGTRFVREEPDPAVRDTLRARLEQQGIGPLYARLQEIDPAYAAALHPNNQGRVLRALELYEQTGLTMTRQRELSVPAQRPFDDCIVGLDWPREQLYARIEARVEQMMKKGLLAEARAVWLHRESYRTAAQAIGYKEFFPYFAGDAALDSCVEKLKQASRNYAKRQLTWFRRMPGLQWQAAGRPDTADAVMRLWRAAEERH